MLNYLYIGMLTRGRLQRTSTARSSAMFKLLHLACCLLSRRIEVLSYQSWPRRDAGKVTHPCGSTARACLGVVWMSRGCSLCMGTHVCALELLAPQTVPKSLLQIQVCPRL